MCCGVVQMYGGASLVGVYPSLDGSRAVALQCGTDVALPDRGRDGDETE